MAGTTYDGDDISFERKLKRLKELMSGGKETDRAGADTDTDRVVGPGEAGVDYGLDEAEEEDRGLH